MTTKLSSILDSLDHIKICSQGLIETVNALEIELNGPLDQKISDVGHSLKRIAETIGAQETLLHMDYLTVRHHNQRLED